MELLQTLRKIRACEGEAAAQLLFEAYVMQEVAKEREVDGAERDHAKACYERAVRILTGIHALLYPPRFTDHDGRTWQFKSPLAEEQMQELSDRIRALPDELAAIDAAKIVAPNAEASGGRSASAGLPG